MVKLELDNGRLQAELEQTCLALTEADTAWNSLSVSHGKLEDQCVKLRAVVDTLKQEKAQVVTYHEVDIAAEQKKFWDYRIGHRRKLLMF
jgi:hypothetical protein